MTGVNRDKAAAVPNRRRPPHRPLPAIDHYPPAPEEATAVVAHESPPDPTPPRLTKRELECLHWTMEGKTAWELSRILGIAENTAVRHLYNATRKLGAANKHQAVLMALRMNLIG